MNTFSGLTIANTLLFDALGKSTLLLIGAFVASSLLRRAPAAYRNLLWRMTFGALVFTTCVSLLSPVLHRLGLSALPADIPIRALTRQHQAALNWPTPGLPAVGAAPSDFTRRSFRINTPEAFPLGLLYAPHVTLSSAGSGFTTANALGARQERMAWMLGGLWLAGFALALLRFVRRGQATRVLEQHSLPLDTPAVQDALAHIGRRLDVKCLPLLRTQSQASGPFSPLTWGYKRAFVLLPYNASAWTPDRLEAVMLHELAHIRRSDWRAQRLCELVCAAYWFHPLAWLAARQMRDSAEQACDDIALTNGVAPAAYARELLAIARTLHTPRLATGVALPFARSPRLESRLRAVLNSQTRRNAPTRRAARRTALLAGALLLPLALVVPVTTHSLLLTPGAKVTNTGNIVAGDNKATLPDGTSVELLGVKQSTIHYLDKDKFLSYMHGRREMPFSEYPLVMGCEFLLRVKSCGSNSVDTNAILHSDGLLPGFLFKKPGYLLGSAQKRAHKSASFDDSILRGFKPGTNRSTLTYGVANGEWTDAATYNLRDKSIRVLAPGQSVAIEKLPNLKDVLKRGNWVSVRGIDTLGNVARRMVAVTGDNKIMPLEKLLYGPEDGKTFFLTEVPEDIKRYDLREIRLQTRPYQWVEFRDVHLQPAK